MRSALTRGTVHERVQARSGRLSSRGSSNFVRDDRISPRCLCGRWLGFGVGGSDSSGRIQWELTAGITIQLRQDCGVDGSGVHEASGDVFAEAKLIGQSGAAAEHCRFFPKIRRLKN